MRLPYGVLPGRPAVVAAEGMVASTHEAATRAGVRALERGGNAADAALAAAAMLCVVEPMSTGLGGDAFAIVHTRDGLHGLDAAGPAPRDADAAGPVEDLGPRSVTVPGAVRGWAELAGRHARFGLDAALADAIDVAERGFAVGPRTAAVWALEAPCPEEIGPRAPAAGERIRLPSLAATLRLVAEGGPDVIYRGEVAEAIASVSWLGEADLGAYAPAWVEPLSHAYRDVEVIELPPPTQGVAALEALALLEGGTADLAGRVASVALATEDALAYVRDGADVRPLLDADHIARRRAETPPRTVAAPAGGTAYVAAVDGDGMAVSLIESLYGSFGSGVAVPGTGIVLQNRGSCFSVSGSVEPGRRPYHTIMPGLILRGGELFGVLGVVGGFMQPQGHAQIVSRLVDDGLDAQAAVDAPRFRVAGDRVHLEEGLRAEAGALEWLGRRTEVTDEAIFGTASLIVAGDDALFGAADSRGDGSAAGV